MKNLITTLLSGLRRATMCTLLLVVSGYPTEAATRGRALWVWNATSMLAGGEGRAGFLAFCRGHGIDTVWMQVSLEGEGRSRSLAQATAWRSLLREAHLAGVSVHALDGNPRYAEASGHETPLALVDAVIDFNAGADRGERFDGIHLDNEPYLLLGWRDRRRRERILTEFLELNAAIEQRVRAAGGLEFGIDIPFWWQARDAATREAIGIVTFRGVRKAASLHCLDLVDTVGIMDYRNKANGPDGLIAHAADLLAYADGKGRARVYIGVETSTADSATFRFVSGIPRDRFTAMLTADSPLSADLQRSDLSFVDVGTTVAVGVKSTASADVLERLQGWAESLGASQAQPAAARALEAALGADPEWRRVSLAQDAAPIVTATRVMLPKLTFAGLPNADMDRELAVAERAFSAHRSYAGVALHHYESYRERFEPAEKGAHGTPGSNR